MKDKKRKILFHLMIILLIIAVACAIHTIAVIYQHTRYNIETFNCVQFTKETIGWFKTIGITSYQVVGICKNNHSLGHSWVGIDIFGTIVHFEPQDLMVFNPEDEYEHICINKR